MAKAGGVLDRIQPEGNIVQRLARLAVLEFGEQPPGLSEAVHGMIRVGVEELQHAASFSD